MSLEIPNYFIPIELFLGRIFSDGKETKLHNMGDDCEASAGQKKQILSEGNDHKNRVVTANQGTDVAAFAQKVDNPQGANRNLADASTGTHVMGTGFKVGGNIILAHKGVTLFEYGVAAASLASAAAAGGFGAMAAPMIRQGINRAIDQATNQAAYHIMG